LEDRHGHRALVSGRWNWKGAADQKQAQQAPGFWLPGLAHQPPAIPMPWQADMQLGAPPRQPWQPVAGEQAQQALGLVLEGLAQLPPG